MSAALDHFPPARVPVPEAAASDGRDAAGRFGRGNTGGPGNP